MVQTKRFPRPLVLAALVLLTVGCGQQEKKSPASLAQELKAADEAVRIKAANQLGALRGEEARQAAPALVEALKDPGSQVRAASARALGSLGAEARPAVPALTKALKDSDDQVRALAGEALEQIKAAGP
jgi:HEAT repeat protein